MMIRSQPPASAHFAERPGPGAGADDRPARRRPAPAGARAPQRVVGALDQLVQPVGHRVGEGGVVDVQVELVQLDVVADALAQRREQRLVRRRVVERPALGRDHRHALQRHEQRGRPGRGGELPRDPRARAPRTPPASCASASRSGCGRRCCGPRTARGTVSRGPKLTMSSAPSETTCGSPSSPAASSRSGPAESTPPTRSSRELGRRQVEHAGEEAAARQRLHRLPAGAGRVEDEHLVAELLEPLARPRHRRRRHAEHRRPDQRPPARLLDVAPSPSRRSRRPRWRGSARRSGSDPEMSTTE